MPTDKEIEAAHIALVKLLQKSNLPVGTFVDLDAFARAALTAAEKVRSETKKAPAS